MLRDECECTGGSIAQELESLLQSQYIFLSHYFSILINLGTIYFNKFGVLVMLGLILLLLLLLLLLILFC